METLPLWKLPAENTCVDTSKAVAQGLPRRGAAELVRYAAAGTEKLHASSKGQWGLSADREAQRLLALVVAVLPLPTLLLVPLVPLLALLLLAFCPAPAPAAVPLPLAPALAADPALTHMSEAPGTVGEAHRREPPTARPT